MKAKFIVTIEGDWLENGKPVTQTMAEKRLREAVNEDFGFLAERVIVERSQTPTAPEPSAPADKVEANRYRTIRSLLNMGDEADVVLEQVLNQVFPENDDRKPTAEELDTLVDGITAAIDRMRSESGKGGKL